MPDDAHSRKNPDIRWKQRFANYQRANAHLAEAVALSQTRALSRLEQQGLIQAFEFTQELAWQTRRFGLDAATIHKIQGVLSQFPEIETAIIYGSRAKGNYQPGSDIDLSLIAETLTADRLLQLENRLDDLLLPYQFDLNPFHALHNPALSEPIERVGKIFYERAATPASSATSS